MINCNKSYYKLCCVPNIFRERETPLTTHHMHFEREREREISKFNSKVYSAVVWLYRLDGLATYNKILSVFNQTKLNTREYTWHVDKKEVVTGRGSSF